MTKLKDVTYNEKYPTYKIGKIDENGNGLINGDYVDITIGDKDFCIKHLTPENSKLKFPKFAVVGKIIGGTIPKEELSTIKTNDFDNVNFEFPVCDKAAKAFNDKNINPGDTVRVSFIKKEDIADRPFFTFDKVGADGKVIIEGKQTKPQGGSGNASSSIPIPPEITKMHEEIAGSQLTLLEREEEFVELVLNTKDGAGMKNYIVDSETLKRGITHWLDNTYSEAYVADDSRIESFYKEYLRRKAL